jgi:splicing factor 3A subunit 3
MSSSVLEQTRIHHADIEKSIRAIMYELVHKQKNQKKKIYQEHRINKNLKIIKEKSKKALEMYEDEERKKEIDKMGGENLQKVLNSFDQKLSEIREYHRNFPSLTLDYQLFDPKKNFLVTKTMKILEMEEIRFTGDEKYGKCLDLQKFHNEFKNIIQNGNLEYEQYLKTLSQFEKVPKNLKNEDYKNYLKDLLEYLIEFYNKSFPFFEIQSELEEVEKEFLENFTEKKVNEKVEKKVNVSKDEKIEKMKKNEKKIENDKEKKIEKDEKKKTEEEGEEKKKRKRNRGGVNKWKEIFLLEAKVSKVFEILQNIVENTIIEQEKKQIKTWEEIQREREEEEMEDVDNIENEVEDEIMDDDNSDTDQEEEDKELGINANPLNLPLGWDVNFLFYFYRENLFHIGFSNYMILVMNSNVRFVVTTVILVQKLLKNTFKNGDTLMV